jgi:hypothetical protein
MRMLAADGSQSAHTLAVKGDTQTVVSASAAEMAMPSSQSDRRSPSMLAAIEVFDDAANPAKKPAAATPIISDAAVMTCVSGADRLPL